MTMTDEPDSLDELLLRYLDGEATEAELARVESDPALRARAERVQAVVELIASPITIPTADLDRIRAAALAESATSAQVTDLGAAAVRRDQRRTRFLAAAAAFVMLAIGVTTIRSQSDDDTSAGGDEAATDAGANGIHDDADGDTSAAFLENDQPEAASLEAGGEAADEADTDMTAGAEPVDDTAAVEPEAIDRPVVELPPVADLDDLEAVLADLAAADDANDRFAEPTPDPYDGVCAALAELLDAQLPAGLAFVEIASVEIAGVPQQVALATGLDDMVITVVFDDACQDLVVVMIDPG